MNTSHPAEQLRCVLKQLTGDTVAGRPDVTAPVLRRMAVRALAKATGGRETGHEAVMDLIGSFHEKLLIAAQKHGGLRGLVAVWCALPDWALLGYVGKMLFHLAVDSNPDWKTVRTLRMLVSAAVAKGPPAPGEGVLNKAAEAAVVG